MRPSSEQPHTSRRAEAERIASELAAMPENQASSATIAKGEEALALLKDDAGSDLWFQLQLRLGSLRLESPDGNRADNVDRAKDHYHAVLEHASDPQAEVQWIAASGLANALSLHPRAERRDFEAAFKIYE